MGRKVAIIGSGVVGASWAMLFANADYKVSVFDVDQEQLKRAAEKIRDEFEVFTKSVGVTNRSAEDILSLITFSSNMDESLTDAIYVQECVPENLELKRKVFQSLDNSPAIASNKVALGSSSSTIKISKITSELKRRSQTLAAHPVNPVFYLRLVEIVPAVYTDPDVTEIARDVMKSIGRAPVVFKKEVQGFCVNRLQYALLGEAWHMVNEGVLEPEEIDTVMSEGLGPRFAFFGPWEIITMNAPKGAEDYFERYHVGCKSVTDTMKLATTWPPDHPATKKIIAAMEKQIPGERLDEFRQLRDVCLQAVAQTKSQTKKDKLFPK